jgi:phosphoserine aminotransferase
MTSLLMLIIFILLPTIQYSEPRYMKILNSPVPLVADMSSDIFSRPWMFPNTDLFMEEPRKTSVLQVLHLLLSKRIFLGKVDRPIPSMLDYRLHIENGSMYNTPPALPIFTVRETLRWLRDLGGVKKMQEINGEGRICFMMQLTTAKCFQVRLKKNPFIHECMLCHERRYKDLEAEFLEFAQSRGMVGIKGHRSVGGFRASIYNALPVESVEALIQVMREFEEKKG